MKMLLKMAWRNIWRNKRRSIITISSIFFAVFFAVFARSFQIGVYNQMIGNMVGMYTGYLQIHQKGFWDEQSIDNSFIPSEELIEILEQEEGIIEINERLESFALTAFENQTKGAIIMGVDFNKENQLMDLSPKLIAGSFPDAKAKSILLSEGLASYYSLEIGDSLILLSQGYHGISANAIYPIQAIAKFNMPLLNKQLVLIPIQEAQYLYGAENRFTSLALQLKEPTKHARLQKKLAKKIDLVEYELMGWKTLMPELVQTIQADSAGGIIILGILYMIITFGIFGTVLMMTAERMHEFGILISIGMRKSKLVFSLLLETIMMGLMAALAGIIVVTPVRYYFHYHPIKLQGDAAESLETFGFEPVIPASVDVDIALSHAAIVLIVVLVCSLYPSLVIWKLKPVKAMRS
jgi:ABC-type lipoprotein release transport system permease subunit